MRKLLLSALLVLTASAPALADVRIRSSPGGEIGPYVRLFTAVRESGQRVIIDGPCLSACTLVLSLVPQSRICVTRRAVLGFHAAWSPDEYGRQVTQREATDIVLAAYPAHVRRWIMRNGGLTRRPIWLRGKQLAAMYPRCR